MNSKKIFKKFKKPANAEIKATIFHSTGLNSINAICLEECKNSYEVFEACYNLLKNQYESEVGENNFNIDEFLLLVFDLMKSSFNNHLSVPENYKYDSKQFLDYLKKIVDSNRNN